MSDVELFCERMRYWCESANLGYSQADRWNFNPQAGNADCSSLVIHCLREAGFETGNATYTGNMSSELCRYGWSRIANDGNPNRGDILLNDVNHVAVYLGDGVLAQAAISENGTIYGAAGDQTGRETEVTTYYNYPWNCYLRFEEADMSIEELYGAKGNDGRNLWDSVIQARNDIAELKAAVGALVWGYKNQRVNGDKDVYKMLTDMPHDVMAYKNQGVNGDKDVYRLVTDLGAKLDILTAKVEKLEKN